MISKQLQKFFGLVVFIGMVCTSAVSAAPAGTITQPLAIGQITKTGGNTASGYITYVNEWSDRSAYGLMNPSMYFPATYNTCKFTAKDPGTVFTTNTHVEYRRIFTWVGRSKQWVNRYVFAGYDVTISVPPATTQVIQVTCTSL